MARAQTAPLDMVRFFLRNSARPQGLVLLWFQRAAYVSGSAFTHWGLLGRLALASGQEVIAPNYRLAPEHPAPAAFDVGLTVLAGLNLPPDRIILGRDSAGAGIAAALAAHLCAQGTPRMGMVPVSPWADITLSGASITANSKRDPLIPVEPMRGAVRQSCGGLSPRDPRVSPLFAAWPHACPTLIQVGTTEVLLDDSLGLAKVLRSRGQRAAGAVHRRATCACLSRPMGAQGQPRHCRYL
jgi:monoterpene epsilon-lactone hydrolase